MYKTSLPWGLAHCNDQKLGLPRNTVISHGMDFFFKFHEFPTVWIHENSQMEDFEVEGPLQENRCKHPDAQDPSTHSRSL